MNDEFEMTKQNQCSIFEKFFGMIKKSFEESLNFVADIPDLGLIFHLNNAPICASIFF